MDSFNDGPDFWLQQQLEEREQSEMRFHRAKREDLFARMRAHNPALFDRMLSRIKVGQSTECWPWLRGTTRDGYGTIKVGGRSYRAPRLMLAFYRGDPGPLETRHMCHNPRCVNPAHLLPGTHFENMRDRVAAGRGGYLKGEHNGRAVLTVEDVLFIRKSTESMASLGRRFGVTRQSIYAIRKRRNWSHIEEK